MPTATIKLTSLTAAAQVITANTNLNGTGVLVPILTSGGTYGCVVTSITVKAPANTTPGMVRIFLQDPSTNIFLLEEFSVYANDLNGNYGVIESFSSTLTFPMGNLKLAPGWGLLASTQNPEAFNIIAEGYEHDYCPC